MGKLNASEIIDIDEKFIDKIVDRLKKRNDLESSDKKYSLSDIAKIQDIIATNSHAQQRYTLDEIAEMPEVSVTEQTLRKHARNYEMGIFNKEHLRAVKKGRSWFVWEEDLREYLEK